MFDSYTDDSLLRLRNFNYRTTIFEKNKDFFVVFGYFSEIESFRVSKNCPEFIKKYWENDFLGQELEISTEN